MIGILLIIFATLFLFSTWNYFKKFLPGFLGGSSGVSPGIFVKMLVVFVLGVSVLKVNAPSEVNSYKRIAWSDNSYIKAKLPDLQDSYQVSLIFDLMTRSAEELARLFSLIVDKLFAKTHSELEAPAAFYKAIMYAGSASIDDPELRSLVDLYASQCFSKVLPQIGSAKQQKMEDEFFRPNGVVDQALYSIPIELNGNDKITCLDVKDKVRMRLKSFADKKAGRIALYREHIQGQYGTLLEKNNFLISNALVNYFNEKTESSALGVQKGAEMGGGFGNFLLGWKRFWSFDGVLNLFGAKGLEGANLAAERALKFNEYLKRAPHLKGLVKLFLIALFPWLVFLIFAGRWKILLAWWGVYFSVLLWTPLWVLLHHLMTSIAISTELLEAYGHLNDGVSMYSSRLIQNRLYQFYAIYTWLQVIIGPLPTLMLAWGSFKAVLTDSEQESAPTEGVGTVASVGGALATGGVSGGLSMAGKQAASRLGYQKYAPPKSKNDQ